MSQKTDSKNLLKVALIFILLVVTCVGASYLTVSTMLERSDWKHDEDGHGHDWLHHELNLTAEEAAAVDALEPEYREQRQALMTQFNEQKKALAELLYNNNALNEDVSHAIHCLHIVHGELQSLSITHYYEMLEVLPPEKQQKLRGLAVEALSQPE